ncbi:PSAF1 [Auxenochlorella protothecoides x Auxenochlorella symbiontica]
MLSSKASISGARTLNAPQQTRAKVAKPVISCSALPSRQACVGPAAAAALALALGLGAVEPAQADVAGLTPCSQSKAFAKREKNEIKNLNRRLKNYDEGTAPAIALQANIKNVERRFAAYGRGNLLCGNDGLPHLIADPGLALRYNHAGEVLVPTIGFIYFAGWIGYAGSKYLQETKLAAKPFNREIIIDVPAAWRNLWEGFLWPVRAVADWRTGNLLADDDKITVSPR